MNEFRLLDLHTEYGCSGDVSIKMGVRVCFAHIFDEVQNNDHIKYRVLFHKGVDYSRATHQNSACLFTKKEIRNHLLKLKSLYPIQFKVMDYKGNKGDPNDQIEVQMELDKVPAIFHKYALTWLRYLYEFPYNVFLKDAYTLKKDPIFRFESIANIFNLVLGCYCGYTNTLHQIPVDTITKPLKISEVRDRIKRVDALNNIYKFLNIEYDNVPTRIGDYTTVDFEYWKDGFDVRKPIYIDTYRKINKR